MRLIVSVAVSITLLATAPAFAASGEPTTDDQKTLYALGLAISQSLGTFALSESELEFVKTGIADGVLKRTAKVDLQTFGPKIQQLQQKRRPVRPI
jgi:FKBP-type peptidyl-prolyl cis-trans isomerase FkpA/FKBP-type peptidyl-prolyl cis-trans isomerase FklB